MKTLIINADDFGLHTLVNQGIIQGHNQGMISSTTIMPGAGAFEEASRLALAQPSLGVGVHLTLVAEKTVAAPDKVSSLVDKEGRMAASYPHFLRRLVTGQVRLTEVACELTSQVEKACNAGLAITHLDSHQHMHIVPGIIDIVIGIARKYKIKALRIPAEPLLFFGGYPAGLVRIGGRSALTMLARRARQKAHRAGLLTNDHFFGMLAGGNMQERFLTEIIRHLPEGTSEIMIHPGQNSAQLQAAFGWPYHWQSELEAVMSPKICQLLIEKDIQLISYKELLAHG